MKNDLIKSLEKLYNESLDDKTVILDLSQKMKSKEAREIIESYLDKVKEYYSSGTRLTESESQNLLTILNCCQAIYNYTGEETGMSDPEYDTLYDYLAEFQDDVQIGITTPVVASKNKVTTHRFKTLRGTLDKIYYLDPEDESSVTNESRRGLPDWVATSEKSIFNKTGKHVNLWDEDVYVFPKWDGVSVIFEYDKNGVLQRALTRGFTETNECQDITHLFKGWKEGPIKNSPLPYGEKTELMMTNEDFELCNIKFGTSYKQSRSIVSSIVNSDLPDKRMKYVTIMSLRTSMLDDGEETLQTLSPRAFDQPYIQCKLSDTEKIMEFAMNHKVTNGLRCDGAVIYIINPEIQKILGRKDNKQKFEVAFKFTEESIDTKLKDIKFSLGLFNSVNPIAIIKKCKIKGNEVKNVSLGSIGRFHELQLRKGDDVTLWYDIIPYLTLKKHNDGELIQAPTHCPVCGEKLEYRASENNIVPELYCVNIKCPNRMKGRILNYLRKMHIDGISYATIDIFYELGIVKTIPDLYKIKKRMDDIEKIPGFGKKKIAKYIDEIDAHRRVPASQFLGSIGIEGMGAKKFAGVMKHHSLDEILNMKDGLMTALLECDGIKEKSAKKIVDGIEENREIINKLLKELDVYDDVNNDSSFKVCFTKIRNKELEDYIKAHGGDVTDTVTKDTSLLVVPMKGIKSSKVSKAQKYNIDIVDIEHAPEAIMYLTSKGK